jgi:phytoene dehydrogenase-like protein
LKVVTLDDERRERIRKALAVTPSMANSSSVVPALMADMGVATTVGVPEKGFGKVTLTSVHATDPDHAGV